MTRLVWVAAVALLAGCPTEVPDDVNLYAVTAAPPASRAAIVSGDDESRISLSLGVAIAARCWDTCRPYVCANLRVAIDDGGVLEAHPVFRATGELHEVVLVATARGTTTLRLDTSCASRSYEVAVE